MANEVLPGHEEMVHDVAWAPSAGRSFQLIATACKDKHVRIFKLSEDNSSATTMAMDTSSAEGGAMVPSSVVTNTSSTTTNTTSTGPGKKRYRVDLVADFTDHEAEVRSDVSICLSVCRCVMHAGRQTGMFISSILQTTIYFIHRILRQPFP